MRVFWRNKFVRMLLALVLIYIAWSMFICATNLHKQIDNEALIPCLFYLPPLGMLASVKGGQASATRRRFSAVAWLAPNSIPSKQQARSRCGMLRILWRATQGCAVFKEDSWKTSAWYHGIGPASSSGIAQNRFYP